MNIHAPEIVNTLLDNLARPRLPILKRSCSSYKVCGYTGLSLAVLIDIGLITHLSLSYRVLAALILTSILTFFGLAMLTKIITGEEKLIYYHHEIAILTTSSLVLYLLNQPILPYLDITILGIGIFLTCGRIGCLMVGCCHGRPHAWGIRYHKGHADEGFAKCFVGVRLFPIQAVEVIWVFFVVLAGCYLILQRHPPGETLALYTMVYGTGRFCFEFVRGDSARPYFFGFSEAQWTTLFLMVLTILGEATGVLTFHPLHAGLTTAIVVIMITVAMRRRLRDQGKLILLHPRHVKELAETIDLISNETGIKKHKGSPPVPVECTSMGIQISTGRIHGTNEHICHYAVSQRNGLITEKTAQLLGSLIHRLRHPLDSLEIMKGNQGIFHLLFHVIE